MSEDLNAHLASLFPGRRIVAFHIHSRAVTPDGWMSALAGILRRRGCAVIGLLTPQSADLMHLENMDAVFTVAPEEVEALGRVDCLIVTDLERGPFPRSSRVLAFMHGSGIVPNPGDFLYGAPAVRRFDGYVLGFPFDSCREDIAAIWRKFGAHAHPDTRSGDFLLMGCGYPKLCMLAGKLRRLSADGVRPEAICYAPTQVEYAPQLGGNRVRRHGGRLVRCLLDSFPDRTVIFRPTPLDRTAPAVMEILEAFAAEDRFLPDLENDYSGTMARTAVMITDLSHISATFRAATRRPGTYFQPWAQRRNMDPFQGTSSTYTELVADVRAGLDALSRGEMAPFPAGLLPFDDALEQLAADLEDFISGRAHAGWLAVPREAADTRTPLRDVILSLLRMPPRSTFQLATAMSCATFFGCRALAAFCLHMHVQAAPDQPCAADLLALAGCPAPENGAYGGMPAAAIARIYLEEAGAAARVGDAENAALLTHLGELAMNNEAIF